MARKLGLTAAVLDAMSDGGWHTCAAVTSAVPAEFRLTANVILSQFFKAGRTERRGEHRAYEYRLLPGATDPRRPGPRPGRRASSGATTSGNTERAATSERAASVPTRNASATGPVLAAMPVANFAASLGTVVGEVVSDTAPPANPAQGRIEDVLAAVLDKREARRLDQLLPEIPNGWSRLDVIGGIADGVMAGWIRARPAGVRDAYLLLRDPPPVRFNPQVERFKAHRLLDQCRALDVDAASALVAAREYDAPPELLRALVDLRRAAARTVQQLEA